MRVAIVTDQYLPQLGGVADSIVGLDKGLRAIGHEVRIFAPKLPKSVPEDHVVRLPTIAVAGGMINIVAPFGLRAQLRKFQPDVIHVHSVGIAAGAGIQAGRALRIPVVGTCHGSIADYLYLAHLTFWPFPTIARKIESWYFNRVSLITAPAQQPLDALIKSGTNAAHMQVISNPVDFGIFQQLPDKATLKKKYNIGERAVMLFGRIAQEKNLDLAVEAFAHVAKDIDAQLVILGDGPYRAALTHRIEALDIMDRTRFLGILRGTELVEAVNACDVMLTTSLMEAQPMAILQAMRCGLPVVGARAGGVPECIQEGITGYICEPDDVHTFSEKVSQLLKDENLRKKFGEAARVRVESYSPESIAKQFGLVYSRAQRS